MSLFPAYSETKADNDGETTNSNDFWSLTRNYHIDHHSRNWTYLQ